MNQPRKLLTTSQVCAETGMHPQTLRRYALDGTLPPDFYLDRNDGNITRCWEPATVEQFKTAKQAAA